MKSEGPALQGPCLPAPPVSWRSEPRVCPAEESVPRLCPSPRVLCSPLIGLVCEMVGNAACSASRPHPQLAGGPSRAISSQAFARRPCPAPLAEMHHPGPGRKTGPPAPPTLLTQAVSTQCL